MALMHTTHVNFTEAQDYLLCSLWQDQKPGRRFPLTLDELNHFDDNEPKVTQGHIDNFLDDIRMTYRCLVCGVTDDVCEAGTCPDHGYSDDY